MAFLRFLYSGGIFDEYGHRRGECQEFGSVDPASDLAVRCSFLDREMRVWARRGIFTVNTFGFT